MLSFLSVSSLSARVCKDSGCERGKETDEQTDKMMKREIKTVAVIESKETNAKR